MKMIVYRLAYGVDYNKIKIIDMVVESEGEASSIRIANGTVEFYKTDSVHSLYKLYMPSEGQFVEVVK